MNFLSDIGEEVDVWATQPIASTLPDLAFVPVCESGIEFNTDYEPVVYQTNRVLMEANAAQELNELQERNHATTAYSTLDCVATPLFPTFNAQRGLNCERREDNQNAAALEQSSKNAANAWFQQRQLESSVRPVRLPEHSQEFQQADARYLPQYVDQPSAFNMAQNIVSPGRSYPNRNVVSVVPDFACGSLDAVVNTAGQRVAPQIRYRDHFESQPQMVNVAHALAPSRPPIRRMPLAATPVNATRRNPPPAKPLVKKMINSVRGSVYDLKNIESLPPSVNGQPMPDVIKYTLTRDKRGGYLLLVVSFVIFIVLLICLSVKGLSNK